MKQHHYLQDFFYTAQDCFWSQKNSLILYADHSLADLIYFSKIWELIEQTVRFTELTSLSWFYRRKVCTTSTICPHVKSYCSFLTSPLPLGRGKIFFGFYHCVLENIFPQQKGEAGERKLHKMQLQSTCKLFLYIKAWHCRTLVVKISSFKNKSRMISRKLQIQMIPNYLEELTTISNNPDIDSTTKSCAPKK